MRNLTLKLQGRGIENISDEEILALLLADEEVDEQVIQLAERLLSDVEGSLQSLATVAHISPLEKKQKVSTRLAFPARIDFISVPVSTIPAV